MFIKIRNTRINLDNVICYKPVVTSNTVVYADDKAEILRRYFFEITYCGESEPVMIEFDDEESLRKLVSFIDEITNCKGI